MTTTNLIAALFPSAFPRLLGSDATAVYSPSGSAVVELVGPHFSAPTGAFGGREGCAFGF